MTEKLAVFGGPKAVSDKILAKRIFWPYVTEDDKKAVMAVLERGILFGHTEADGKVIAPETEALQKEFAEYIGVKYCLAVNSGTAALHIALAGCGVGIGDEVITSAFSYIATPMAIMHAHAVPVFADIDIDTHNLDVGRIEKNITPRTKAIMPVHMNGLPCDMDKISAVARKHNLFVIEDAAQAWGSVYKGKKAGSFGNAAAFSLNGTKNFSVGEGGLFVTDDKDIYERARAVAMMGAGPGESFGEDYSDKRFQHLITYNYKVQELTSALARSRLRRLDKVNKCGFDNALLLNRLLGQVKNASFQTISGGCTSTFYKYRLRIDSPDVDKKLRDQIFTALKAEGVDVTMWQQDPLPAFPVFQEMAGYGKYCPWIHAFTSDHYKIFSSSWFVNENYRRENYPNTQKLLDSSLVICSESYPIFCQPKEVIESYAGGIKKVFENISELNRP
ncbi:MAG: DegT/DnrJ/EryC1/StrS family aminotransferase [Candidatus Liptonbacteria bacterium]|nr:DegT/DnrJ/EryC1/StrS family aminotransferase [Candidatus Liptonbacteria bacterium]